MTEPTLRLAVAVLAAGASRRLGQPKQAVRLAGRTLLRRSLELACSLDGYTQQSAVQVHLISGAHPTDPADVAGLDVRVHHNADWASGQRSSVALAAREAAGADAMLVLLCDQYRLGASDLAAMLASFESQPDRVVAASYAGTRGAPVIWPARMLAALASGRQRGQAWLDSADVRTVSLERAAFDLDSAQDLTALRRYERSLEANG